MNRDSPAEQTLIAQQIITRMSRLRQEISENSTTLVAQTRQTISWKHQVAVHPIASTVAVMVVGYLLVPTKKSGGGEYQVTSHTNRWGRLHGLVRGAGAWLTRRILGMAIARVSHFASHRPATIRASLKPSSRRSSTEFEWRDGEVEKRSSP